MGWRFRYRKRTKIIPGLTLNWKPWTLVKAILDGPGGKRMRDAFTSHTWRLGPASWNSRGRRTFDTPGPGYVESGRYRPRDPEGRTRWGCVWAALGLILAAVLIFWNFWVVPWWDSVSSAQATTTTVSETDARVSRVVDGDTFDLATGDRVRVLGLDSCEASDPAGPAATADARSLLDGQEVTVRTEPGVERDRYGRLLRYVELSDGRDFATVMVGATHSKPYTGGDASADYMRTLRSADPNGQTCRG